MARMLGDYWSEGGEYIDEGDHLVSVKEVKFFTYNSGTKGVEYTLINDRRQTIKMDICLHENTLWKLSQFVKALGLSRQECASFDVDALPAHQRLVNRLVMIRVVKEEGKDGKKYSVVDTYWQHQNGNGQAPAPAPVSAAVAAPVEEDVDHDDIPF